MQWLLISPCSRELWCGFHLKAPNQNVWGEYQCLKYIYPSDSMIIIAHSTQYHDFHMQFQMHRGTRNIDRLKALRRTGIMRQLDWEILWIPGKGNCVREVIFWKLTLFIISDLGDQQNCGWSKELEWVILLDPYFINYQTGSNKVVECKISN